MSDKVTMTALDTVHVSNVQSENLQAGDVFIVSEADAKVLEKSGAAERGGTTSKAVNADSPSNPDLRPDTREALDEERGYVEGKALGAAPANKMVAQPATKALAKPAAKRK